MAKLIIHRPSEWFNRLRDIGIYVDGQKLGSIANADSLSLELEPGSHEVQAKIDWCSSLPERVKLTNEKATHLRVTGFRHSKRLMPWSFGLLLVIWLAGSIWNLPHYFPLFLLIPVGIYLLYYLTLARKQYLKLIEISDFNGS